MKISLRHKSRINLIRRIAGVSTALLFVSTLTAGIYGAYRTAVTHAITQTFTVTTEADSGPALFAKQS